LLGELIGAIELLSAALIFGGRLHDRRVAGNSGRHPARDQLSGRHQNSSRDRLGELKLLHGAHLPRRLDEPLGPAVVELRLVHHDLRFDFGFRIRKPLHDEALPGFTAWGSVTHLIR
jgi:hypothetical protein